MHNGTTGFKENPAAQTHSYRPKLHPERKTVGQSSVSGRQPISLPLQQAAAVGSVTRRRCHPGTDTTMTDTSRPNAIQTEYQGYTFRSRLEARWAVFFDALNIEWRYEHEGFELNTGEWYLPDFYLPNVGVRSTEASPLWIEIKPTDDHADFETAAAFVDTVKEPIAVLTGRSGDTDPEWLDHYEVRYSDTHGVMQDVGMHFMACEDCGRVKYEFEDSSYMGCDRCGARCSHQTELIQHATKQARSARFEHGETPGGSYDA